MQRNGPLQNPTERGGTPLTLPERPNGWITTQIRLFRAFLLNSAFPFPQIVTLPQYPTSRWFRNSRYCAMGDKRTEPKNNAKKNNSRYA